MWATQGIVDRLGGSIRVRSRVGQKQNVLVFQFSFPIRLRIRFSFLLFDCNGARANLSSCLEIPFSANLIHCRDNRFRTPVSDRFIRSALTRAANYSCEKQFLKRVVAACSPFTAILQLPPWRPTNADRPQSELTSSLGTVPEGQLIFARRMRNMHDDFLVGMPSDALRYVESSTRLFFSVRRDGGYKRLRDDSEVLAYLRMRGLQPSDGVKILALLKKDDAVTVDNFSDPGAYLAQSAV